MTSLKDQGNAEFKAGAYLKSAASYTKAIKEEPENAVLFRWAQRRLCNLQSAFSATYRHRMGSNRSVALLKLLKVQRALEDAEACIRIKPEWEKGALKRQLRTVPASMS